jgi:hypothetical protein
LDRFVRRFPVSLLAFERLHALLLGSYTPEEAVLCVLRECCERPHPTVEDVQYFIERAEAVSAELLNAKEKQQESTPPKPDKGYGASYRAFLSGLESHDLLLLACNFDPIKAHHIYTELDREDALALLRLYTSHAAEERLLALEATVFGMGGGYSSGGASGPPGASDEDAVDLSEAGFDELRAAFNALG